MRQIVAGGSERKKEREGKQGKEKEHEHKGKAEGHGSEQNEPMWIRQQK